MSWLPCEARPNIARIDDAEEGSSGHGNDDAHEGRRKAGSRTHIELAVQTLLQPASHVASEVRGASLGWRFMPVTHGHVITVYS